MYESLLNFPGGLFGEFDRLRRQMDGALRLGCAGEHPRCGSRDLSRQSISARRRTASKSMRSRPGCRPTRSRSPSTAVCSRSPGKHSPEEADNATAYTQERLYGSFRRAVSLPEDVDPSASSARYQDGLLRVSIARKEAMQPKRITVN